MDKVLIICGPTATGKTRFGIEMAKMYDGEIVSADSRQIYVGKNLIYGKDLPTGAKPRISKLKWNDRYLKYYEVDGIKIWLYDIVEEGEGFNVSFWHECAQLVIINMLNRQKLPIIVGGTGLYIKSLTHQLTLTNIPPNPELRKRLENKSLDYLQNYLVNSRVNKLNESDWKNPRRLIRAIEIVQSDKIFQKTKNEKKYNFLQIGLTGPQVELYQRIDQRVNARIADGAAREDAGLAADPDKWKKNERQITKGQMTWFKKQPRIHWFDIGALGWQKKAEDMIDKWYNTGNVEKG